MEDSSAAASTVARTTASPAKPTQSSDDDKDEDDEQEAKTSSKTTASSTSTAAVDKTSTAPKATPTTPFAPSACSDSPSTLCCDNHACTDRDEAGGLTASECRWQPASSYYYCAYTCASEGYAAFVDGSHASCSLEEEEEDTTASTDDGAASSSSSRDGSSKSGSASGSASGGGDAAAADNTNADTAGGGGGASNTIATAGYAKWFTSCSEAADCSGSFDHIQSDCVSSTCSYACSSGALNNCAPGGAHSLLFFHSLERTGRTEPVQADELGADGMEASCTVAAEEDGDLSATCAVTCTSGYGLNSDGDQCTKSQGGDAAGRLRWRRWDGQLPQQRHPTLTRLADVLPVVEPTPEVVKTMKHPKWFQA